MRLLLHNSALANVTDMDKYTPLHWAAANGDTATIRMLLNAKANINARTKVV